MMAVVHEPGAQRRPGLTHALAHTRPQAQPPPSRARTPAANANADVGGRERRHDGADGGALSLGVFSVDELLWTCRPTDPGTLHWQHQKGCRLFEQQERTFFARPGREIIRAGYLPEDLPRTALAPAPPVPPQPEPAPQHPAEEPAPGPAAATATATTQPGRRTANAGRKTAAAPRRRRRAATIVGLGDVPLAAGPGVGGVALELPVGGVPQGGWQRAGAGAGAYAALDESEGMAEVADTRDVRHGGIQVQADAGMAPPTLAGIAQTRQPTGMRRGSVAAQGVISPVAFAEAIVLGEPSPFVTVRR